MIETLSERVDKFEAIQEKLDLVWCAAGKLTDIVGNLKQTQDAMVDQQNKILGIVERHDVALKQPHEDVSKACFEKLKHLSHRLDQYEIVLRNHSDQLEDLSLRREDQLEDLKKDKRRGRNR